MKIPPEEMQAYQKGEGFVIPDDSYEDAADDTEIDEFAEELEANEENEEHTTEDDTESGG